MNTYEYPVVLMNHQKQTPVSVTFTDDTVVPYQPEALLDMAQRWQRLVGYGGNVTTIPFPVEVPVHPQPSFLVPASKEHEKWEKREQKRVERMEALRQAIALQASQVDAFAEKRQRQREKQLDSFVIENSDDEDFLMEHKDASLQKKRQRLHQQQATLAALEASAEPEPVEERIAIHGERDLPEAMLAQFAPDAASFLILGHVHTVIHGFHEPSDRFDFEDRALMQEVEEYLGTSRTWSEAPPRMQRFREYWNTIHPGPATAMVLARKQSESPVLRAELVFQWYHQGQPIGAPIVYRVPSSVVIVLDEKAMGAGRPQGYVLKHDLRYVLRPSREEMEETVSKNLLRKKQSRSMQGKRIRRRSRRQK